MSTSGHRQLIDQASFENIIGLVYDASLNKDQWPIFLKRLGSVLRDANVGVGIVKPESGDALISHLSSESDPSYSQLLKEQYGTPHVNPGLRYMMSAPSGTIVSRESIQNDFDMERSDFYNDVMRPYDFWHAATGSIHRSLAAMFPFGAMRRRSAGPFDRAELDFLVRLTPHLNRAMHVFWRLHEFTEGLGLLTSMLDRVPFGVVAVNAYGLVGMANRQAEKILDADDGLLIRRGRLTTSRPEDSTALARCFAESAGQQGKRHRLGSVIHITRRFPHRALPVVITPLGPESPTLCQNFNVSVAFKDLDVAPQADADLLSRIHGLTPREAAVAAELLQGRSPAEAAEVLEIRMTTMRTHIQRLLNKTNTTRLSELVAHLVRSPFQW